ncbi:hypothetical protein [Ensifer aridi]|uniref:hypothetical protein n=1 Tax=Ensifer aridi TaxID=1708715 RepID=UPI003B9693CF
MEGDLLIFKRTLGNANVTSLVERKSRYAVMINGSRHSQPLIDKIIDTFALLPASGTEFRGSGLWKMDLAPGAGSAIRTHRGRKGRSRAPTSASAALCRAIRTFRRQPAAAGRRSPSCELAAARVPGIPHAPEIFGTFAQMRVVPYRPLVIVALVLGSPSSIFETRQSSPLGMLVKRQRLEGRLASVAETISVRSRHVLFDHHVAEGIASS